MHFSHQRYSANGLRRKKAPAKAFTAARRDEPVSDLVLEGLVLVFLGMGVMVVAMLVRGKKGGVEVKGGGVVMIGPVPIIFGSDMRWASVAIALAILLIMLSILLSVT